MTESAVVAVVQEEQLPLTFVPHSLPYRQPFASTASRIAEVVELAVPTKSYGDPIVVAAAVTAVAVGVAVAAVAAEVEAVLVAVEAVVAVAQTVETVVAVVEKTVAVVVAEIPEDNSERSRLDYSLLLTNTQVIKVS